MHQYWSKWLAKSTTPEPSCLKEGWGGSWQLQFPGSNTIRHMHAVWKQAALWAGMELWKTDAWCASCREARQWDYMAEQSWFINLRIRLISTISLSYSDCLSQGNGGTWNEIQSLPEVICVHVLWISESCSLEYIIYNIRLYFNIIAQGVPTEKCLNVIL